MGILDDAIKEHLELKRRHGAGDSELQQLEDEAFGAAERPGNGESAADPLAEAPTQFMEQPEPEISSGPSTEEREAIAEQPTEMYDVEEELASEPKAPSEEQLVEEEMDEPRLAPVDPLSGLDEAIVEVQAAGEAEAAAEEEGEEYEEDDDFWDEKRLSDELDQALEAPSEVEEDVATGDDEDDELTASPEGEEAPASGRDEDVLEETPDFLEETPEDDQLWFEQKPPKDFDFDD
jgi:hypothetical protein